MNLLLPIITALAGTGFLMLKFWPTPVLDWFPIDRFLKQQHRRDIRQRK